MTVKEKARELVSKFQDVDIDYTYDGWPKSMQMPFEAAKACAIIHVEEMIDMAPHWFTKVQKMGGHQPTKEYKDYWQQIKKEIEGNN